MSIYFSLTKLYEEEALPSEEGNLKRKFKKKIIICFSGTFF